MTTNADLNRPEGLSNLGNAAYDKIMAFLTERGLINTGGCKAFYSPKEWADRGEDYGTDSELIVVHDGGDHAYAFSWSQGQYDLIDAMVENLNPLGVYSEQCTSWYSAVYKA
jgi:hypothetical protein